MGPAQFNRHCLLNLICLIEPAHELNIGNRKASAKFSGKFFGDLTQLLFAVCGTLTIILLMLNNNTPNVPVSRQKLCVDMRDGSLTGIQQ